MIVAWFASFLPIAAVTVWLWLRHGPRLALAASVPLSMLVPVWVTLDIAGQAIDVRIGTTVLALVLYVCHRNGRISLALTPVDLAGLGLMATHVISDIMADGPTLGLPFRVYGEWFAAFAAGRLAFQSFDDVRKAAPWVIGVSCAWAFGAIVESVTKLNLWEIPYGLRPINDFPRDIVRYGFRRSYGPTRHPIFFGALQFIFLAWPFALRERTQPAVKAAAFALPLLGVLATVSRGPILALIPMALVAAYLRLPRYRLALAVPTLLVVGLLAVGHEDVLAWLNSTGGEKKAHTIVLDGETIDATGTESRVLLFKAYARPMRAAGMFGFGTARVTDFPVRVPYLPAEKMAHWKLRNIDNFYILLTLRFGFVGLLFGVLLLVTGTVRMASFVPIEPPFFAAATGMLCGMMLILLTVWLPQDFAFALLWMLGLSAGLRRVPEY